MAGIPLLPAGARALTRATELIRDGITASSLVVTQVGLLEGSVPRVIVQLYSIDATERADLEADARARGGRFGFVEDVWGFAANDWNELTGDWTWDLAPGVTVE